MTALKATTVGALCAALGACASIPEVTQPYYFPKARTQFVVTQTIGCSAKPKAEEPATPPKKGKPPPPAPAPVEHRLLASVITVAATTANAADLEWTNEDGTVRQGRLAFKPLDGTFVDGDASITLTADGRLSGVNATSTGEGSAIIKNLVTLVGTAAMLLPAKNVPPTVEDQACDVIDTYSAVGAKPDAPTVTLTYSVTVKWGIENAEKGSVKPAAAYFEIEPGVGPAYGPSTHVTSLVLKPDPASATVYQKLATILGSRMETTLSIPDPAKVTYLNPPTSTEAALKDSIPLELTKIAIVSAAVDGHVGNMIPMDTVWAASVPTPTHVTYKIPIPKPQPFGKTAFGVALSDYGSITTLHYGSSTGVAEGLDAMNAIAGAAKPKTAAERAAEIQGQADLIAQQQRLVKCQVNPETCE